MSLLFCVVTSLEPGVLEDYKLQGREEQVGLRGNPADQYFGPTISCANNYETGALYT